MELKDYLHLYLGCECHRMGEVDENDKPTVSTLTGISYDDTQRIWWAYFENNESGYSVVEDVFPILRPLSDMAEEEKKHLLWDNDTQEILAHFKNNDAGMTRNEFLFLLSKHFDLFGLIDGGLAIDKTSLQQPLK
jgi:hypothetical protein